MKRKNIKIEMLMSNYLKIKKALQTGDSVELDGHFFNVFDLCILEKKLKEKLEVTK